MNAPLRSAALALVNRDIDKLTEGMTAARESADGQERPGFIILTREAYEKLYYAAYDAKKVMKALKEAL